MKLQVLFLEMVQRERTHGDRIREPRAFAWDALLFPRGMWTVPEILRTAGLR